MTSLTNCLAEAERKDKDFISAHRTYDQCGERYIHSSDGHQALERDSR